MSRSLHSLSIPNVGWVSWGRADDDSAGDVFFVSENGGAGTVRSAFTSRELLGLQLKAGGTFHLKLRYSAAYKELLYHH